MLLRKLLLTIILGSPALSLTQNLGLGQAVTIKTERFLAGHIDLPLGFKAGRVIGPDFNIDYIIPEGAQLNNADVLLEVYTGAFSSLSHPTKGVKTKADSFGGHNLKWYIWKIRVKDKVVYHYETLIPLEGGQWHWHISITAPNMQHVRVLLSILKSYRAM